MLSGPQLPLSATSDNIAMESQGEGQKEKNTERMLPFLRAT